LVDTAGIRETEDLVENIGVEKSKEIIEKSDLILISFRCISRELEKNDYEIIELIRENNKKQ
jgi:tRNA modification GTPase